MSHTKLFLEGVCVCVNYGDFLAETLPQNKQHFNRLVVVTDTNDKWTKTVCEYHHVKCVQTDVFYENGDVFNKGKGINEGLKHLSNEGWVVQLDADIYLPPMMRAILEKIELDPQTIYSMDRVMCPNYVEWRRFMSKPRLMHEAHIYVHTEIGGSRPWPIGVRIAEYMNKGYEPIGFFQMWNPQHSGVHEYPTEHGKADRTDVLHAKKFSRIKRQMLPELLCIHLDSEGLKTNQMGKNWNGRKTFPFTVEYLLGTKGYGPSCWTLFWMYICSWFSGPIWCWLFGWTGLCCAKPHKPSC